MRQQYAIQLLFGEKLPIIRGLGVLLLGTLEFFQNSTMSHLGMTGMFVR